MSDWETVLKLCSNYLETTYGLPRRCLLAMVWAELKNGFPEALMNEDDNARQNIADRAPKAEVEDETGAAEVESATETNISTLLLFNKTEMTP